MKSNNSPTPPVHALRAAFAALVMFCVLAPPVSGVEYRTWTNTKGQAIEAKLVRVDDEIVIVEMKNGKRAEFKRKVLSQADIEFLAEYGGKGAAEVDLDAPASVPEKSARIDTKAFKKWDKPMALTGLELSFEVLETPHFLLLSNGSVREKDTAENAEALWHGMAFQHPSFARKWEDRKMAILLVPEEYDYNAIGSWYASKLTQAGQTAAGNNLALTWPKSASGVVNLEPSLADEHSIFTHARVFKVTDPKQFSGAWGPFRTHCISGDLLDLQMGGVSDFASTGFLALSNGHGYYKEIQLCERSETVKVNADAYASDEVKTSGGFEDGRRWAKTIKDLVRKDKVKPSIDALYRLKSDGMTPTDCVLTYAFSRYLQSTVGRLANYAKLAERVETSNQVPEPIELAKLYGFETVKAMEDDWIAFMGSSAFR